MTNYYRGQVLRVVKPHGAARSYDPAVGTEVVVLEARMGRQGLMIKTAVYFPFADAQLDHEWTHEDYEYAVIDYKPDEVEIANKRDRWIPMDTMEYARSGGFCCPYCGSGNVVKYPPDLLDDGDVSALRVCGNCNKRYVNRFILDDYEEVE